MLNGHDCMTCMIVWLTNSIEGNKNKTVVEGVGWNTEFLDLLKKASFKHVENKDVSIA